MEGLNEPLERIVKSMQQSSRKAHGEGQGMRFAEGTKHKARCDGGPFDDVRFMCGDDAIGGREERERVLPLHEQIHQTVRCDVLNEQHLPKSQNIK